MSLYESLVVLSCFASSTIDHWFFHNLPVLAVPIRLLCSMGIVLPLSVFTVFTSTCGPRDNFSAAWIVSCHPHSHTFLVKTWFHWQVQQVGCVGKVVTLPFLCPRLFWVLFYNHHTPDFSLVLWVNVAIALWNTLFIDNRDDRDGGCMLIENKHIVSINLHYMLVMFCFAFSCPS